MLVVRFLLISLLELKDVEMDLGQPTVPVYPGLKGVRRPFGTKTGTSQANREGRLPTMTPVFLKVHTTFQRAGMWPLHALSAGEFSQKPSGLKPFVPVSLPCPCIAKGKPDILNMKIFHILQGNLLLPEIAGFGS